MSWMQKLYEVYQACEQRKSLNQWDDSREPLPLYHDTRQAQVEVGIDREGNWVPELARAITDKQDMETIVPVTEKSASRTSSPEPMPLFDKLIYIAGDYDRYVPADKEREQSPFSLYLASLRTWCEHPDCPVDVKAWLTYIEKRRLMQDLVEAGILTLDDSGMLHPKWAGTGKPQDAFVRFCVLSGEHEAEKVWLNPDVTNAFKVYLQSLPTTQDVCYVMGELLPLSYTSPKGIRYAGDATKLISSNDTGGFTYRGRFQTAEEALVVGRDTTEKAHAALKWLIRKQGYRNGEQVVLAFGTGGNEMPSPVEDTLGVVRDPLFADDEMPPTFTLKESIARALTQALHSTSARLDRHAEAIVMGLDSAIEGKGRLAIFYYRELSAKDYFDRILSWHTTCTWLHTYRWVKEGRDDSGKEKGRFIHFTGAPSLMDIVLAAYGKQVSDKLKKSALERLLPCVVDGARLPRDIVSTLARRAAQRAALDGGEREKVLSIACALIKKSYNHNKEQEVWTMALQPEVNDRSYLFGRAWAYAEAIERYALNLQKEKRDTNAERLMVAFPRHPMKSWGILSKRLNSYQRKLGGRGRKLVDGMNEVISRLELAGYTNEPLSDLYLLGYAAQKHQFRLDRLASDASELDTETNEADETAHEEE